MDSKIVLASCNNFLGLLRFVGHNVKRVFFYIIQNLVRFCRIFKKKRLIIIVRITIPGNWYNFVKAIWCPVAARIDLVGTPSAFFRPNNFVRSYSLTPRTPLLAHRRQFLKTFQSHRNQIFHDSLRPQKSLYIEGNCEIIVA